MGASRGRPAVTVYETVALLAAAAFELTGAERAGGLGSESQTLVL